MKYMYVYPIEKFGRDAEDETILRAWKEGGAEHYTPEEFAELVNDDEGYFEISCLHRDDTDNIEDSVMERPASKPGDDYCG